METKIIQPTIQLSEQASEAPVKIEVGEQKLVNEPVEISPSAYQEVKKQPLVSDLLKMGEAYTHFEMESLSKEIDEFIQSEIKRQNLKDNQKTYEEILNKYKDRTNLPEGIDVYTLTEQILEHIRIDRKLIEAMVEKQKLEEKPLEELTSRQLKARIEGK